MKVILNRMSPEVGKRVSWSMYPMGMAAIISCPKGWRLKRMPRR